MPKLPGAVFDHLYHVRSVPARRGRRLASGVGARSGGGGVTRTVEVDMDDWELVKRDDGVYLVPAGEVRVWIDGEEVE